MATSHADRMKVSAIDDRTAVVVDAHDALSDIEALLAVLDGGNVWRAIAWDADTAAADARRAVRRVERALVWARQQAWDQRAQVGQ